MSPTALGHQADEATTPTRSGLGTVRRGGPPVRVTHVLLDVDGTLVDSSGAALAAHRAVANRCSALANFEVSAQDVIQIRQSVNNDPQWHGTGGSAIRHETIRRLLAQHDLANEATIRDLIDVFTDARNRALTVFPDVHESLAALRALGIVLIAASNGDVDLERIGLAEYIANTHYACDIGVSKPDPRFFALALSRFDIAPRTTLAVGDRFDNDYEPSRATGLHAVLLDRVEAITDPSITRIGALSELPALVERL